MTWETWTNGLNQSEIACKMPQCNPEQAVWGGIPSPYEQWFLIFLLVAFVIVFIYVFIFTGVTDTKSEIKKEEPEKISKGKRK